MHLYTNGKTKSQKIGGIIANDLVLDINEVKDGFAIEDISKELRHAANITIIKLKFYKLDTGSVNNFWLQQCRLIEDCHQNDEEKFGIASTETVHVVESFCFMHFGVNLRKPFLNALVHSDDNSG